jgi:hypothetical protein
MGGAGDDRYSFAIGDGQDKIIDTTGTDTVAFGPELNAADLTVAQRTDAGGRWLDLAFVGGDSVAIKDRKERTMKINDMAWRRAA